MWYSYYDPDEEVKKAEKHVKQLQDELVKANEWLQEANKRCAANKVMDYPWICSQFV